MDNESEGLTRIDCPSLDAVLGRQFKVLDGGFVRVVDYMGSDASVVQAARISYGKGTRSHSEDRGLIRYLMRNRHTTPFEMCEIKIHVRAPMDVWRQWIRHRTANVNEYSTRYSVAIDAVHRTPPRSWRRQSSGNRQGSSEGLDAEIGTRLSEREQELHSLSQSVYEERLEAGVAREQARKDLPLSTFTEAYWKIDAHNLFHFLALRMDSHAQLEIREYASVIGGEIMSRWLPICWEAFRDYRLNAIVLSSIEQEVLSLISTGDASLPVKRLIELGWLDPDGTGKAAHRERRELELKLKRLGIEMPWPVS